MRANGRAANGGASGKRIYRFRPYFSAVNLLQAAVAVLAGGYFIAQGSKNVQVLPGMVRGGLVGAVLLFAAAYLVAETAYSAVILEQDSVSLRGVWGKRTLARGEILGVKTIWILGIPYTTIQPKNSAEEAMAIGHFFSFNEEWLRWMATLPDLDVKHTLEVIQGGHRA